ncbi:MAG TPA: M4 family metallopeptidase, partial [Propionibacteriaceae bacterium]
MHCRFLPPYLVNELAAGGAARSSGPLTLRLDDELRARRAAPPRKLHARRAAGTGTRIVHTAHQTEQLPGDVVRTDGGPPTHDPAVDEAYESSGQVWDLFQREFRRSSVDGEGTPLSVTVHYGQDYDNAFWDGRQLVFGDGDGEIFERFTKPLDVLAHEFAHGVTQFTAGLNYQGQPGALNESVSDVFAAMTRQRVLAQTAVEADWLIGVGLFADGVQATALRSMLAPGTAYDDPRLGRDRQVGHWSSYVDTEEDSGGVHINSGIPNRAFAEAARAIGGHCWKQPGQ